MDRNALKAQALLEKVSQITTQNENEKADLRVEVTILSQENAELREENEQLKSELDGFREREQVPEEPDAEASEDDDS